LTDGRGCGTLAGMQTLGLSGESKRSDGAVKSLLWPTVENAWDVDYLGRQGLTICTAVAAIQVVAALFAGNPIFLIFGLASAIVFLMGGMGVREGSWAAAAMVFSLYVAGMLSVMAQGRAPGIVSLIVAAVLLSNLRATVLSAMWKPPGEGEDKPTRFDETVMDFLTDQLPAKAWPWLRYVFFFVASILLLLILVGLIAFALARLGILKIPHP
jgi:hypothetical protein